MDMKFMVNTSVDDIRSSLFFYGHFPSETKEKIQNDISYLNENVKYEMKNRNRRSVINLLLSKIKQLEKQLEKKV